jgi:hypothetical protein
MANLISDETLDSACEEVGNYSDDQARFEMERLSKAQPALLAYVMASTEDLEPEAQEVAIYMFVVIHKAFEKQFADRLQVADINSVEQISDANDQAILELFADDERIPEAAAAYVQKQPVLFNYVAECFTEPEEGESELSEDDQGALSVVMKTVIDVLDSSVRDQ